MRLRSAVRADHSVSTLRFAGRCPRADYRIEENEAAVPCNLPQAAYACGNCSRDITIAG
jgi:hypothetical protein